MQSISIEQVMMFPMVSLPKKIRVFIDETSDQNNQFGLVAVLIESNQEILLRAKWEKLQIQIRDELRLFYPRWNDFETTHPDSKPEIHAVNMLQSSGYFRNVTHSNPLFWHQHSTWIGQAFAIQGQFGLPVIGLLGQATHGISDNSLADVLLQGWVSKPVAPYMIKKLEKLRWLEARAYTWALPTMLFHLEAELSRRNCIAEIVCDEGNEERGFRLSELLRTFQASGIFTRIQGITFCSSESEIGLQIADIHAYAILRTQSLQNGFVKRKETDYLLEQWNADFTNQQRNLVNSQPLKTREHGLARMLSVEYIIRHSGFPTEVIQAALGVYQRVLDSLAPP